MEIATRLDQSRFESVFCASRYWDGLRRDSVQEAERRMDEAGVRYFGLGRRSSTDLHRWLPLRGILRRERVDVLHAHMFGSNVWGTVIGRLARVPVIVAHEHTWSFEGRPLRRFVDREVIGRGSTAFIAVSRDDQRKMIEIERVDRGQDPPRAERDRAAAAPDRRRRAGGAWDPGRGAGDRHRQRAAPSEGARRLHPSLGGAAARGPRPARAAGGGRAAAGRADRAGPRARGAGPPADAGLPLGRGRRDGDARRGGLVVGLRGQPAGGDGVHGVGPADRGDPRGRRTRPDRGRRARPAGRARRRRAPWPPRSGACWPTPRRRAAWARRPASAAATSSRWS